MHDGTGHRRHHVCHDRLHHGTRHRRHHVAHHRSNHVRHDRLHDATRHRRHHLTNDERQNAPDQRRDVGNHRGSNVTEEGCNHVARHRAHHVTDEGRDGIADDGHHLIPHERGRHIMDYGHGHVPRQQGDVCDRTGDVGDHRGDHIGHGERGGGDVPCQRAHRLMRLRAHNVGGGRRCDSTDERHGHWTGLGRRRGRGRLGWRGAKRRCGDVRDRTVGRWGGPRGGELSDCGVARTRKSVGDVVDDGPDGGRGGGGLGRGGVVAEEQ